MGVSILVATIGSSDLIGISLCRVASRTPMATECCNVVPLLVYHLYLLPRIVAMVSGFTLLITCSANIVGIASRIRISKFPRILYNSLTFHCNASLVTLPIDGPDLCLVVLPGLTAAVAIRLGVILVDDVLAELRNRMAPLSNPLSVGMSWSKFVLESSVRRSLSSGDTANVGV